MIRKAFSFALLFSMSCSFSPTPGILDESPGETREGMLTEIRTLAFEENYKECRKAGKRYLLDYGDEYGADEVRLLVGSADLELGFFEEAKDILIPLIEGEGEDSNKGAAYILLAKADRARGFFREAVENLLRALAVELDESQRMKARNVLKEVVEFLSREQTDEILAEYASDPGIDIVLGESLSYAQAVGDTAATKKIFEELVKVRAANVPQDETLVPTEGVTVPASFRSGPGEAARFRVGLLCPMNSRFSPLAEAFLRGASLALKEARQRGVDDVELVVGDTRARPLDARSSARKLIEEENVIAIVGGVLSTPTIAAAQVAEFNQTVFLSPLATEEGIGGIGDWVFQTIINAEVEIIAVVKIARSELGIRRFAFLSVDDDRSRWIERVFRAEVERSGGEICVSEFYSEGSTDFNEQIERIRNAAPEALFIASDIEDLILILPQFSFYEFGV
ncbi:MAG: amino acid ABC transporter substrate-binding protein, partial [Candidatus Krumholzibacteria bacterium]|nr:amino acid ABC transporter substrate-binding protein [Candidatus Krumholzibacteria bacterium]